jgi:type IV secretion system protein VirB10
MSATATPPNQAPQPPPPDVAIRAKPPSPRRLSRKVLFGGAIVAGSIVAITLLVGLSPQQHLAAAQQEATPTASGPPESISQASSQYDASNLPRGQSMEVATTDSAQMQLQPPTDPMLANAAAMGAGADATAQTGSSNQSGARVDPQQTARISPILFAASSASASEAPTNSRDKSEANLDAVLMPPRSSYEIQAGNVIAAALLTGLNSDLAGRVIAQVTAPVFDSLTGEHLLVPQGARLIGTYSAGATHGDHRLLLVWDRIIFPNGWSLSLHQMNAADPTGAAGIADTTDEHLGGLAGAIGLSSIISVLANNSQNDHRPDGSLTQSVGDAAAQQAAQTGSQIVGRELQVHPTLRVRPGASIRVLVTRDIALRPYR